MLVYAKSVWRYRYFWGSLVRMDLRGRYRGSWLGIGWSLLHPLAMATVMCVVFHNLFGMPFGEFLPNLVAGLVLWQFLTNCASGGCQSLLQGEAYIRQFPAPMAIYPLRTTLGAAFHFGVAAAVVLLGNALLNGFDPASGAAVLPGLALLLAFGWSLAVLTAFANVYFPDAQHLIEVGFQLLFYMTPIIYPADLLRKRGTGWLLDLNPLTALIDVVRSPLLGRELPGTAAYLTATALVLFTAGLAVLSLNRLERKVIFQL